MFQSIARSSSPLSLICGLTFFNGRAAAAAAALCVSRSSTDSAKKKEKRVGFSGHAERRHHRGRWSALGSCLLPTQDSFYSEEAPKLPDSQALNSDSLTSKQDRKLKETN